MPRLWRTTSGFESECFPKPDNKEDRMEEKKEICPMCEGEKVLKYTNYDTGIYESGKRQCIYCKGTGVDPVSEESTVESAMEPTVIDVDELTRDIAGVLNKHCYENLSDTPDFILAEYVVECLRAWNGASTRREKWYGYKHSPGQGGPTPI